MFVVDYFKNKAYEMLIIFSVIFLIGYGLYRWGKKGTYNVNPFISKRDEPKYDEIKNKSIETKNRIPQESKGENVCRQVIEYLFEQPFPKARPNILRNPIGTNQNLELDCYNENLKLAVEYNGIQHYQFSNFFHKNKDAFSNQLYRDEIKRRLCKENGITLIEVPYTVSIDDIPKFIAEKLVENGYH